MQKLSEHRSPNSIKHQSWKFQLRFELQRRPPLITQALSLGELIIVYMNNQSNVPNCVNSTNRKDCKKHITNSKGVINGATLALD